MQLFWMLPGGLELGQFSTGKQAHVKITEEKQGEGFLELLQPRVSLLSHFWGQKAGHNGPSRSHYAG